METQPSPIARLRLAERQVLLFAGQALSFGRAAENDIILHDPQISRLHAALQWTDSGFAIRDQSSANGTLVNGERLGDAPYLLRDGDTITLSSQTVVFEILRSAVDPVPQMVEQPQRTRPALVVIAGPDMGQTYPLWGETITIGRASHEATWEIRLTDRSVSRPHARLEQSAEGLYLADLESANGTTLNDSPVRQPLLLRDQDVIGVGESKLLFAQ